MSVSQSVERSGSASGPGAVGNVSMTGNTNSGSIAHMMLSHFESTNQGSYTVAKGQIAKGVSDVTLMLSDDEHVQTTIGDGWFLAWWPGAQEPPPQRSRRPAG